MNIDIIPVRYIMKWLYILFTMVIEKPVSIPSRSLFSGMDERFPFVSNDEEIGRIRLHLYYLEQIRWLESSVKTSDNIMPIIREVLPLYEISPGKMSAGGLMDDWERNI